MKSNLVPLLFIAGVFALTGCANIAFYSDEKLEHPAAVKLPMQKPYLLITYSPDGKTAPSVQIVSLPDPKNVLYARREGFIGSTALTAAWANGAMASIGATVDPKADAVLTAVTGAAKLFTAEAAMVDDIATAPKLVRLFEIDVSSGKLELKEIKIPPLEKN